MKNKKLTLLFGITAGVALGVFLLSGHFQARNGEVIAEHAYLLDKEFRCNGDHQLLPTGARLANGSSPNGTLDYFKFLEQQFAVKSLKERNEHFLKVEAFLETQFTPEQAHQLFSIYKRYLECEIRIKSDNSFQPKTADPVRLLSLLHKIQNFRRDQLGKDIADAIFGSEVKEREYLLRKSIIIDDTALYGKDKESKLQTLKLEMWNAREISAIEDDNPYNQYQLKTQIYRKDLAEMDAAQRKLNLEQFKKEIFSKESLERLEEVERQLADEKVTMARYRAAEQEILNAENLTSEEKDQKIKALQEATFGQETEAFRRREAIRHGAEKASK